MILVKFNNLFFIFYINKMTSLKRYNKKHSPKKHSTKRHSTKKHSKKHSTKKHSTKKIFNDDSQNDSYDCVFLTFNQGNKKLEKDDISSKLTKFILGTGNPHIIVITLQEAPRNPEIFDYFNNKESSPYKLLASENYIQPTLGYLHLAIYVLRELKFEITKASHSYCYGKFGLPSLAKGGIFMTLSIPNSVKIQFAGLHLPSDPSKPEKRTECLKQLLKKHQDGSNLIIGGDLNYRSSSIKELSIEQKKYVDEYKCTPDSCTYNKNMSCANDDQLSKDLKDLELEESIIKFCPTCRLEEGRIKNLKYDHKRMPSWCDRILTRIDAKSKIKLGEYKSLNLTNKSDHDAVYQQFQIS